MRNSWIQYFEAQARLPLAKQSRGFALCAWPLSMFMWLIVFVRNAFYDFGFLRSECLPGKVLSVGNIVAGGVGKSPFVQWLAAWLLEKGEQPAVLQRGYGSGLSKDRTVVLINGEVVLDSHPDAGEFFADEACMLSASLRDVPIIIGSDRLKGAKLWMRLGGLEITHWILDDGYQHRKIHRDKDIVLLTEHAPFGNGCLLPLGILREPIKELRRAHVIVAIEDPLAVSITESERHRFQALMSDGSVLAKAKTQFLPLKQMVGPTPSSENLLGMKYVAMTGIARPERFFAVLQSEKYAVIQKMTYLDHQRFQESDISAVSSSADACVVTEKDYWRDPSFFKKLPIPTFVLPMRLLPEHPDFFSI